MALACMVTGGGEGKDVVVVTVEVKFGGRSEPGTGAAPVPANGRCAVPTRALGRTPRYLACGSRIRHAAAET